MKSSGGKVKVKLMIEVGVLAEKYNVHKCRRVQGVSKFGHPHSKINCCKYVNNN